MPLPWKKAKGSRISRLVADHLQPPNRGGSLVVETGFPTSLVDLFVKNRDRLRKPSKKKRSKNIDPIISPGEMPPFYSYTNPNTTSVSEHHNLHPRTPSPWLSPTRNEALLRDVIGRLESASVVVGSRNEGSGGEAVDAKGVFVAVLKMFLVVVLALGTKKFMFGIGLSALLLFFFEYVVKRWHKYWEPCSNAPERLKSVIKTVWCYCHLEHYKVRLNEEDGSVVSASVVQEAKEEHKNGYASEVSSCSSASDLEERKRPSASDLEERKWQSIPVEGFEIVQPNLQLLPPAEEIHCARVKFDCGSRDNDEGMESEQMDSYQEILDKGEGCERELPKGGVGCSRRTRLKSKMKKLVPKKLRPRKKSVDACFPIEEGKVGICEVQVEDGNGEQYECDDEISSLSSGRCGREDVVISRGCGEMLLSNVELTPIREVELGRETSVNLDYLVLCVIVLLGLIGGRILALVLTVFLCLMLKSGKGLWRYVKIPVIKSTGDCCR